MLKNRQLPRSARGYIDNRPLVWIILILAAIGGWNYLELTGVAPAGLWDRVPGLWKALLACTGGLLVVGLAAMFVAVRLEDSREPFQVEARGDRHVIQETNIALRTFGVLLLVTGLAYVLYGIAGAGWFSWAVLALATLLVLAGVSTACDGKRFVVEPGRLAAESRMRASWNPDWSCAREGDDAPALELKSTSTGGAFGQPLVEHHAIVAAGKEIYHSPRKDRAEKLLALLRQALDDTRA
jgi:hypothetical protein